MFYLLALSAIIFVSGLYGVLTRRTLSGMLPSIYLMLTAAAFNCIIFNSLIRADDSAGYLFGLAIVVVGLATFVIGKRFDRHHRVAEEIPSTSERTSETSPGSVAQKSEPMASDV